MASLEPKSCFESQKLPDKFHVNGLPYPSLSGKKKSFVGVNIVKSTQGIIPGEVGIQLQQDIIVIFVKLKMGAIHDLAKQFHQT
jgi:hypothetical protein